MKGVSGISTELSFLSLIGRTERIKPFRGHPGSEGSEGVASATCDIEGGEGEPETVRWFYGDCDLKNENRF